MKLEAKIPLVSVIDNEGLAQAIGGALEEFGAVALVDHGIADRTLEEVYTNAQSFFSLPAELKRSYFRPTRMEQPRGYMILSPENSEAKFTPLYREGWHMGPEFSTPSEAFEANVWPAEAPGLQPAMTRLYWEIESLSLKILDSCSEYLGVDREALRTMTARGPSLFRLMHYPPIPEGQSGSNLRFTPHEDLSVITLMCQPTASGLELYDRDRKWRQVPQGKNLMIVNVGEILEHLSNGRFRSCIHRVVTPSGNSAARLSMPFFSIPHADAHLAPFPACVERENGRSFYSDVSAGRYLAERIPELTPY